MSPSDTPERPTLRRLMTCGALALFVGAAPATAATAAATPTTAPTGQPAPKKPQAKPAAKPQAKPAPKKTAPAPAPEIPDVPLTLAQINLANYVLLGDLDCDAKQQVSLWPVLSRPGYFELRFNKAVYILVPHVTATGAVRLEDSRAGVVWLQIPAKSMLLDARQGQRLADGCMHAAQRYEQADTAAVPASGPGLGITGLQR